MTLKKKLIISSHTFLIIFSLWIAGEIVTLTVYPKVHVNYECLPSIEVTENCDSLTEWQVFVMALIEVECERNPNVKSNKNAIGPFQITEVYVSEVNRLYNTNFIFEDAWNLNKSIKMFELMNDYYNPNRDINKAIQIHNPGAGSWYAKRIKERMKLIKFSELVRSELTNLNS